MLNQSIQRYVAALRIGAVPASGRPIDFTGVETIDFDNSPHGIVTGCNLIAYPQDTSPEVRSGVALTLLATQRVAASLTPDQNGFSATIRS